MHHSDAEAGESPFKKKKKGDNSKPYINEMKILLYLVTHNNTFFKRFGRKWRKMLMKRGKLLVWPKQNLINSKKMYVILLSA